MPNSPRRSLQDGDLLAAVDLGSNSFHLVVARYTLGQLRIVDRIKETVRLAEGLDGEGGLSPDVMPRALDCLARFGQRIDTIPAHRVRAIATNTVRALRNPQVFLMPAETAISTATSRAPPISSTLLLWLERRAQTRMRFAFRLEVDALAMHAIEDGPTHAEHAALVRLCEQRGRGCVAHQFQRLHRQAFVHHAEGGLELLPRRLARGL